MQELHLSFALPDLKGLPERECHSFSLKIMRKRNEDKDEYTILPNLQSPESLLVSSLLKFGISPSR